MKDYRVAEIAYEAYRAHTGGKSLVSGAPIPQWSVLPLPIRDAWLAASDAVIHDCIISFPKGE